MQNKIDILGNIKGIRKLRHYTQIEMAKKMGIEMDTYSRLELGKNRITWNHIEQIAGILKISVIDLIRYNRNKLTLDNPDETYQASEALKKCKEELKKLQAENLELLQEHRKLARRILH